KRCNQPKPAASKGVLKLAVSERPVRPVRSVNRRKRPMPLLDEKTRRDVQEMLADIAGPARLVVFTQPFECDYCKETREIVEEIAELSDQISVEVYDFQDDARSPGSTMWTKSRRLCCSARTARITACAT